MAVSREGLLVLAAADEVVGIDGGKPVVLRLGQLVVVDFLEYVFGFVEPAQGNVASGLPELGLGYEVGHPGEVTRDVEKGSCGLEELALVILGLAHQSPGVVDEGVVLVALEVVAIFGVAHLSGVALGLLLDGVELDGFLALLDGAVEAARGLRVLGVGIGLGRVHVEEVGEVVLILGLHVFHLLLVVFYPVEIDVVAGRKAVVKAGEGRILLGRTGYERQGHQQNDDMYYSFFQTLRG